MKSNRNLTVGDQIILKKDITVGKVTYKKGLTGIIHSINAKDTIVAKMDVPSGLYLGRDDVKVINEYI